MRTRNFFKISFFAVASILFFSCSNLLEKEQNVYNDSASDGNARLILSIGVGNGARTIFADDAPLEDMNYILSGSSYTGGTISIPLSYEKNTDKLIRSDGETEIFVGKGTWNFKLTASKHETALYESEIFNFDTKAGDNALYFKLSEIKTAQGYGDIDISLNFYNEIGATKIVVDLLDLEGRVYNTALQKTFKFEPIVEQTTINYKLANVTSGAYIVQFAFFKSGQYPCHIYRELVQVRPNRTSTAEREIEKFERNHEIELIDIENDVVLNFDSMSLVFNEQEQVILPTKNDVSRKGYEFEGWYTIENGIERKYTMIPYGTTTNIMLYPKWKLLQIETITFTNVVNANGNVDLKEKTLTLTVDIFPDPEIMIDEQKTLTWSCSDISGKVSINQNGVVSVEGDDFRENTTITVTAPGGAKAEIVIEGHIKVLTQEGFRKLCEDAGSSYNTITSITIPDDYTVIGAEMFSGCSSLTSITIPSSVTLIDNSAFYGCSKLNEVHYNGTIEQWCGIQFNNTSANPMYYAKKFYLGDSTEELTEIIIPNSVTKVGDYQFYGFNNITKITIPDGVTSIGENAFRGCTSLTDITIPGSVTSIGENAFLYCSSLKGITILDGVTSIGNSAFDGCSSLTEITIPGSVTSIGDGAFDGCSSLTEIIILDGVTSIGNYAFKSCTSLTEITIPASVISIGIYAFCGCSSLSEITILGSVVSIKFGSFQSCSSLKEVRYKGTLEDWCGITFDGEVANPMYYAKKIYFGDSTEELTEIVIPNTVTKIGSYQFFRFSSLTKITIPDGVTSIGNNAFRECTSLTDITIPGSVTSIGNNAFIGCTSLTDITIPDGITSIKDSTFYDCSSLKDITIPDGVTSISYRAFYHCTSLTEITIPGSVTSIGNRAFESCTSLTEITIPSSVTSIGEYAFSGCSSLTSATFENPNNWHISYSSDISDKLSVPSTAATCLKETYVYKSWSCY